MDDAALAHFTHIGSLATIRDDIHFADLIPESEDLTIGRVVLLLHQ